ncbi:MAG: hypothetical protein ACI81V_001141 [Lentimonas sp.]|jgi:hypothetical protein
MSLPNKPFLACCIAALAGFSLSAQTVELLPYEPLTEAGDTHSSQVSEAPAASADPVTMDATDEAQPRWESMLPATAQSTALNTETIMVSPAETQARNTPRKPKIAAGSPVRQLNGKLERRISSFGPRYPIRLTSESGKRIAYVDMSYIFIHDLRPYLDTDVAIQGEVRPLVPGSKELVIVARSIRLLR